MPSQPGQKRPHRKWRSAIIAIVCLATFLFFGVVSMIINAQPSTRPFAGWVAVLQPDDEPMVDHVGLIVEPWVPGAPGTHPGLTYSVVVCGDRPFHGILVIGGDARLTDLRQSGLTSIGPDRPAGHDIPDLVVDDIGFGKRLDLGETQIVDFDFASVEPCLPTSPTPSISGVAARFTGTAGASIQRHWNFGWWSAPRQSQAWPRIGALGGSPPGDLGSFVGVTGLSGSWGRPPMETFRVDVGTLTAQTSVDAALPASTEPMGLGWEMSSPFQPSARLTDTSALGRWQPTLVIASILLGLGGGVLATQLFEWSRAKPAIDVPDRDPPTAPQLVRSDLARAGQKPLHAKPFLRPSGLLIASTAVVASAAVWIVRMARRRSR
ncbi:hypothetical protein K7711_02735 [Nocardia sp. CA2R105]|uniref:hypothetical protein n=1 Tax=Nocardia coffeae TaxID=2873381 RepID=UPI001CA68A7A|nr:hypothetical protein [Nocardia coffeae]MBY8855383.1 hypothetical protein [Nocardia coffeae]